MNHYSYYIFWHPGDDCYFAVSPEFPNLSAFGDTPEDALKEFQIVLNAAIEIHQEEKWPLPKPQPEPKRFKARIIETRINEVPPIDFDDDIHGDAHATDHTFLVFNPMRNGPLTLSLCLPREDAADVIEEIRSQLAVNVPGQVEVLLCGTLKELPGMNDDLSGWDALSDEALADLDDDDDDIPLGAVPSVAGAVEDGEIFE